MPQYGNYDPSRKILDQAKDILAAEGVVLPAKEPAHEAPIAFQYGSLQEAAQMLIEASGNIPLDHIMTVGGSSSRSHHKGE